MGRAVWNQIIHSKRFYVETYRTSGTALVISMIINLLLGVSFYYAYFSMPDTDYYSTNGVTAPIMLTALDTPNYTSNPLLASDEEVINNNKLIPQ